MFLNILVGIDGSPSSQRALEYAIELARAERARLTLMTVAPPAASFIMVAGVMPDAMREELDKWAQEQLADAVRTVPDELNAQTVQGRGHPGPEIVKELKRGGYDLIVLGSRGRGRTQEGLLGSVNGYVHFHAHVPLLSVPDATEIKASRG